MAKERYNGKHLVIVLSGQCDRSTDHNKVIFSRLNQSPKAVWGGCWQYYEGTEQLLYLLKIYGTAGMD